VDSDFELMLFFGCPPSYLYQLTIDEWTSDKKKHISSIKLSDTSSAVQNLYFGKKYFWKRRYKDAGSYKWTIDFSIKDSLNQVIVHDTSRLVVTAS
jgi:hypothetical protein